jgi:ABC-type oligopeptide transport system substrate-binding subunit
MDSPIARRRAPALARTLAALAALTLATGAAAAAETTLHRGLVDAPETLDPQRAATASETEVLRDLFEGLVAIDAKGAPVPGAAESWTVSADGLVYTFQLRKGARWSNGDAVKAMDFVNSFRRLFSPATDATEDELLQVIRNAAAVKDGTAKPETLGVRAVDPATLEITLAHPTPTFLARLALPVAFPVYVSAITRLGADFGTTGKIISNGPYRLGAIDRKDGYLLVRNPRFWSADTVAIDNVTYRAFETPAACVDAYRAGEVETCADVPAEDLGKLRDEFGAALRVAPYAGTYFLTLNTRRTPFDDVRIRQALSLAIDRDALASEAWSGGMVAASTLVPPSLSGRPAPAAEPIDARRAEARKLLDAAGYGGTPPQRTLDVEIRVGTGAGHEETARLVSEQWKTVGVDATIRTEPNAEHFAYLRSGGDFQAARAGWIVDEADPIDLLALLRGDNRRFNYSRYDNPDFDRLLDEAAAEPDAGKRGDELAAAEAIIDRDAPVIPLLGYASLTLVSPRIKGWQDNATNQHPTRYLALSD